MDCSNTQQSLFEKCIAQGQKVVEIEAAAVLSLKERISSNFGHACELLYHCIETKGRIVVIGMGKSGHIGRKIAATFSSTGSPAIFCPSCRSKPW